jgi:hypothetical protein
MKSASNIGSRQRNLCRVFFFFAESFSDCSRQRSLLAECFFFAESFLFGSRQSLLYREFSIWLSAKSRALGKACDSGSGCQSFRMEFSKDDYVTLLIAIT